MSNTTWTVTSPSGQILHGVTDGDVVVMSSAKGNHGTVTVAQWTPAEALLCNACYEAAENGSRAESLTIPSLEAQAQDAYQQDATSAGTLLPEDL